MHLAKAQGLNIMDARGLKPSKILFISMLLGAVVPDAFPRA